MNKNIYKIIGVAALGFAGAYFLSFNKSYEPRQASQLAPIAKKQSNHDKAIKGYIEEIDALRVNQVTGTVDYKDYMAAKNATRAASLRRVAKDLVWEELGPDNVGGRTRALLIDKDDNKIMYMGAVSGGLWKSTTSGTSWKRVNDNQENLNVVSIAQAANGDIYYGTGEGAFVSVAGAKLGTPGFRGGGIFKSTDGGNTFAKLASTSSSIWQNVNKMAADPTDANRIYAATGNGFYHTTDGGASWIRTVNGSYRDVQVATDGTIFAFSGSRIYKSTDKGVTLPSTGFNIPATSPSFSVGRISIAISPQDKDYVYALISNTGGTFEGLARTTDGGANWERLVAGGPTYAEIFGTNGQGDYDNIITVDPLNKNRVFMGGVGLAEWDSERGYTLIASTFVNRTNPGYVHADKHEMKWDLTVSPPVLWIGTDGGLFRSNTMHNANYRYIFSEQNRGYITTQYFGLAAGEDGTVMGGTQDNGTQLINGTGNSAKSAVRVFGGDGFQTEIAHTNPDIIFAESQYGAMQRSTNGATSFAPIWDNRISNDDLDDPSGLGWAPFNTHFKLYEDVADSSNSKLFFAPYGNMWAAVNVMDQTNRPIWFRVSPNYGNTRVTSIEVSANGDNLFYSTSTSLFRIDSLNHASFDTALYPSATDIPSQLKTVNIRGNLSSRVFTSIAVDPSNPNRALATAGSYGNSTYVYLTNNVLDASPTWVDVTNNLPKMPVYHGLIMIDNPNYFVVATEMGIWASDDNGATWEVQNQGMPTNVASYTVRQYEFKPWEGPRIYVATHGRGFFRSGTFLTDIEKPQAQIAKAEITVYPNPTTDYVTAKYTALNSGVVNYNLYSLTGKNVLSISDNVVKGSISKTISTKGLPKGTYILSIGSEGNKKATKVIVN